MLFVDGGSIGQIANFVNPNGLSRIVYTNMESVIFTPTATYANTLPLAFRANCILVASNDLELFCVSVPNPSNDFLGYASIDIYDDTVLYSYGHKIIKNGAGSLTIGMLGASGWMNPRIDGASELQVNGCDVRVFQDADVKVPVIMRSFNNLKNENEGAYFSQASKTADIDIELNNAYLDGPYSGALGESWLERDNSGDLTVNGFGLIYPYKVYREDTHTWDVWQIVFSGDVRGNGTIYKGYSNVDSGVLRFTGSISPGTNDIGEIYFRSLTNQSIQLGIVPDKVDLNIEVDGLGNIDGVDHDSISVLNNGPLWLDLIDLKINNSEMSNPYRSNLIIYCEEGFRDGHSNFNSIAWSDPSRIGQVVIAGKEVYLTGIPAATNMFFDAQPEKLIFVQGETQKNILAQSPFSVDVNCSSLQSWIQFTNSVSLNNSSVNLLVNVPENLPVNPDSGMSNGIIRLVSENDSSIFYDVSVFVVEQGYFELDESILYFIEEREDSKYVGAASPLVVNLSVESETGDSWISIDSTNVPVTLSLTDSYENIEVSVATNQSAGTKGKIWFSNSVDGVSHSVDVKIVENGYFEVSPPVLEIAPGETRYFNVSSPFRADVNITADTNNAEFAITDFVSLDENGFAVPVIVPISEIEGGTGTVTFVNSYFTNISYTAEVSIVPEPTIFLILDFGFLILYISKRLTSNVKRQI